METGLIICVLTGCARQNFDEAKQLVERYNQVVSEAYRRGDPKLIDPVAGPNEGKKILGLIGVRSDLGLTMDSHLVALAVTGVEKSGDEMRVRTKEEWTYRDLKIGSGEQVGQASHDTYEMLYLFKKFDKQWLVDEIQFTAQPQVGRTQGTWMPTRPASAQPRAQP